MSERGNAVAISARNVSKRFNVYKRSRDMLLEFLTTRRRHHEYWALKDISFDVHFGEVVGVVGRNGAGKSTLLKILSGIIAQTGGQLEINGKVASILELGTGFHPEYSGKQNILLAGLCLGMRRVEIERNTDWIVEFSELREFIDQPLKTYSSGMQARLAFSIATSQEPEILVVDEALGIGDIRFQRKCFRKFEEFREQGKAIIFVSHNTPTIDAICDRALYLKEGNILWDGEPKKATGLYLKDLFGTEAVGSEARGTTGDAGQPAFQYGNRGALIIDFGILDVEGNRVTRVETGGRYTFFCKVRCNRRRIDDVNVGISLRTVQGIQLFAINPLMQRLQSPELLMCDVLDVRVGVTMWLAPGEYFLTFGAWGIYEDTHYDRRVDALQFSVQGDHSLAQSLVNLCPLYEMSVLKHPGTQDGGQGRVFPCPTTREAE